jgi:Carboxypeptidase regulatory-like domain
MTARRQIATAVACLASITVLATFPARAQDQHPSAGQFRPMEASGSVVGIVQSPDGIPVADAQIALTDTAAQQQTVTSGLEGAFAFNNVPPGTYLATIQAKGFLPYTSGNFRVAAGQAVQLSRIQLSIAAMRIVVRPTEEIAEMQMKAEEKQRVAGIIPDFYTSYVWNAAPLNTRQKISLSTCDLFDPASLLSVAAIAGIEQAAGTFRFGSGAAGYGKRFGAALGDELIGGFLDQAVFPSMFHQDPRYFYMGSGSVKSCLIHALL